MNSPESRAQQAFEAAYDRTRAVVGDDLPAPEQVTCDMDKLGASLWAMSSIGAEEKVVIAPASGHNLESASRWLGGIGIDLINKFSSSKYEYCDNTTGLGRHNKVQEEWYATVVGSRRITVSRQHVVQDILRPWLPNLGRGVVGSCLEVVMAHATGVIEPEDDTWHVRDYVRQKKGWHKGSERWIDIKTLAARDDTPAKMIVARGRDCLSQKHAKKARILPVATSAILNWWER